MGETCSAIIYYSHYFKAILEDLKKHFHYKLQESLPDGRLILLERRRALYLDSVIIKPQSAQNLT